MLLTSKENSTVHMRNVKTNQTKVQDRNAIDANYLLLLTNGRTGAGLVVVYQVYVVNHSTNY